MASDREFLLMAFDEAERAFEEGTFPIGAIIVDENGLVVGRGRNRVFSTGDTTIITYTWNGSRLVPNKPYPKQFQASSAASQGGNSISTKSYPIVAEAANHIAAIQGGNGVGPGSPTVNLGNGITARESAGMGHARYVWQEGNWTIQIRYYTRNSSAQVKQVAESVVSYLHTHRLPAPNKHGVIVVNSMDANTAAFRPQTIIAWQEGTQVNELQQTGNPIQALQTAVKHK